MTRRINPPIPTAGDRQTDQIEPLSASGFGESPRPSTEAFRARPLRAASSRRTRALSRWRAAPVPQQLAAEILQPADADHRGVDPAPAEAGPI